MQITEYHHLAGQIISGQQEELRSALEEVYGQPIWDMTIRELVNILIESREHYQHLVK